jgi:hypothetical protein
VTPPASSTPRSPRTTAGYDGPRSTPLPWHIGPHGPPGRGPPPGGAAPPPPTGRDPVYAWSTRGQVDQLTKLLEAERDSGRPVPRQPAELATLLQRNFKSEDLLVDAWGTPFFLEYRVGTVRVVSAGPDRARGPEADLKGRPVAARGR